MEHEQALSHYRDLLLKQNESQNLISRELDSQVLDRLIDESASLARLGVVQALLPERALVADLGAGGGLLGITYAIINPQHHVLMIESLLKKCRAIEAFARELGLDNVELRHGRVEKQRGPAPDLFIARFFMDPRGVVISTRKWRSTESRYLLVAGAEERPADEIYELKLKESSALSKDKVALHYAS